MSLQRFWYITSITGVIVLTFYLGFLYGNREQVNDQPNDIQVVGPNLSIRNSLTEMQIRDIVGSRDSQNIEVFGQFFFKTNEKDEIEILIQMRNVPAEVVQSNGEVRSEIPQQLRIQSARRSIDGLDYEYKPIGVIIFDEPINDVRSGKFSTILTEDIATIERIVFTPEGEGIQNVFTDTSPDLPPQVRSRPAPFFWSEI